MAAASTLRPATSALAFRGYNQTNLGRTPELLARPAYRPYVLARLEEASALCADASGRSVDLAALVADRIEPRLDRYAEAIALVFAAELAQLDLLRELHGVEPTDARLAIGYSLGELVAVTAAGLFPFESVMRPPLEMAADCAELAGGVTMAVVFSRRAALDERLVHAACEEVTCRGKGELAVSAVLSPNTLLVIGQGDTIAALSDRLATVLPEGFAVRKNDGDWPPLHTPLVRRRSIADRAWRRIAASPRLAERPRMPICSLVTGRQSYTGGSARETLRDWTDHPQRLWDGVVATLASDAQTVIHVGPSPNVIPATFRRLAENVVRQTLAWSLSGVGLRTVQLAGQTWLAPLLPAEGRLLRAPMIEHVVLEDWLLENAPP
ncbi:MAG: ACP S-malonyltransferase [Planctomycetota bacterium]